MTDYTPEHDRPRSATRRVNILKGMRAARRKWKDDPFLHEEPDPGGRVIGEMLLSAKNDIVTAEKAVRHVRKMVWRARTAAEWANAHPAFEEICDYFCINPDAERDKLRNLATAEVPGFWAFLTRAGECECPLCNSKIQFLEAPA